MLLPKRSARWSNWIGTLIHAPCINDRFDPSHRSLPAIPQLADSWLKCALAERDVDAAKHALNAFGENKPTLTGENVPLTRLFLEGVTARMTKDDAKAQLEFAAARAEQEKIVQAQANHGPALCLLGLIDAGLGHKEQALREGRRAVELLPVEKDAINGPAMIRYLAVIAAWVGDNDLLANNLPRPAGFRMAEATAN